MIAPSSKGFMPLVYQYPPLVRGQFLRRYKRFLADIELDASPRSNVTTTVHCPNTGSMLGLLPAENLPRQCACTESDNSKRKYKHTIEMVEDQGSWVGIHSSFANAIVRNCLTQGLLEPLLGYFKLNQEITVAENCKLDFELLWAEEPPLESRQFESDLVTQDELSKGIKRKRKVTPKNSYSMLNSGFTVIRRVLLEVKSVTLAGVGTMNGQLCRTALFPDCVSERAQKHCRHLTQYVQGGGEATLLFLVQRDDCVCFSVSTLDPEYGKLVSDAVRAGVQVLVYACRLDPNTGGVHLAGQLPFIDSYKQS